MRQPREALLRWYRVNRRDLPWRRSPDPYAIWVSEIMLQQTQVATVLPYYSAFLKRFPDVATLAVATEDDVLAQWTGLGYYRRARSLHRAAQQVLREHGGKLPPDPAALLKLPGIGRYTAGAIASIAFDRAEPILDGNVRRVLARCFGIDGAKLGRGEEERQLWGLAGRLVRGASPGDLNQALMELGAMICLPREPHCSRCPLRSACFAVAHESIERLPAAIPRKKSITVRVGVAVIRRGGKVLVERPDDRNPFRGKWDLPAIELDSGGFATEALRQRFDQRHGLAVTMGACLGRATHGILHRRLKLEVHSGTLRRGRVSTEDLSWVVPERLSDHPVSGATRKILRQTS